MIKNVLSIVVVIFFSTTLFSQSPAGVSAGSTNEMWFDANQLGLTNGQSVSSWLDMSGQFNNANQSVLSRRPTFLTNQVNGKPALSFVPASKTYLTTASIPNLDVNTQTIFLVSEGSASNHTGFIIGNNYTTSVQYNGIYRQSGNMKSFSRNAATSVMSVLFSNMSSYNILESDWDGSSLSVYRDETFLGSKSNVDGSPTGHMTTVIGADPSNVGRYNFDGNIAEIIYYSSNLNSAERTIVLNYLASKYGITITSDYYAYESTHEEDLIGIGQEADGSNTEALSVSTIQVSNMSTPSNGDYVMLAHEGSGLVPANNLDVPSAGWARYGRVWRAGVTGTPGTVTITFDVSEVSLGFPNSYVLLVDGDGVFASGATQYMGTYNGGNETVTFTGVALSDGDFIGFANSDVNILSTNVTTDWHLTTTWNCGCIPGLSSNVEVVSGHTVEINGQNASAGELLIEGTLTVTGSDTLTINGDYTNNGTFNPGTGTLYLIEGVGAQTIDGTQTFHNLTMDNSSGVSINSGETSIQGFLNVVNGTLTTNNSLTLISNASGTGMLFNPSAGTISGNLTAERYLNEGDSWYLLGSPLTDSDLEDWNSEFEMQGFDGTEWPEAPYSSVYTYDETATGPTQSEGYQSATNTTNTTTNTVGWSIYIGGDSYGSLPRTIDATGTPRLGDGIVINGTYTVNIGSPNEDGWNLVANPYQSPVRYSNVTKGGNYDKAYRKKANGSQQAINNKNIISPGEAFWLHCLNGPCSLTFDAEDVVDTSDVYNLRLADPINENLIVKLIYNEDQDDQIIIGFNENATDNYDIEYDGYKLSNAFNYKPNLSVVNNEGHDLLMGFFNKDFNGVLPLRIYTDNPSGIEKNYSLEFNNVEVVTTGNKSLIIEDRLLGTFTPIIEGLIVDFEMNDSYDEPRFFLHVKSVIEVSKENVSCYNQNDGEITVRGFGDGPFNYTLYDEFMNIVESTTNNVNSRTFRKLQPGDYKVVVTNNDQYGEISDKVTITEPNMVKSNFTMNLPDQLFESFSELTTDTFQVNQNQLIEFNNLSLGVSNFNWNFGDGGYSEKKNPSHMYFKSGIHRVTLTSFNDKCSDEVEQYINVRLKSSDIETNQYAELNVIINENELLVELNNEYAEDGVVFEISNSLGQIIYSEMINTVENHVQNIPVDYTSGFYIINVRTASGVKTKKIILNK